MDKIVRIRQCELCGNNVVEDFDGPVFPEAKLRFKSRMHTVVIIPPEGGSKNWMLCAQCAKGVSGALEDLVKARACLDDLERVS